MRLTETLPRAVTANGRRYRVDLDFRKVFDMLAVMRKDDLIPSARVYRALRCVMRRPPRNDARCMAVFAAVCGVLFSERGKKPDTGGPKLTDFEQDADLIRAAFLQAYGINLWRDKLHWVEFTALLGALPGGSRYADILGIRARPMPEATKYNAKEREQLAMAKAACALELREDERATSYAAGLRAMSESMRAYAMRAGEKNAE